MSTYVIAKRQPDDEHGRLQPQPADVGGVTRLAIYTDHRAADDELRRLGTDQHEIVRLSAMQLLRWMVRAYEQGAHHLEVNPPADVSMEDMPHGRLVIDQQLAHFAELLTRDVVTCVESAKRDRQGAR